MFFMTTVDVKSVGVIVISRNVSWSRVWGFGKCLRSVCQSAKVTNSRFKIDSAEEQTYRFWGNRRRT